MNLSQAARVLELAIPQGSPIMLLGPPGLGKTACITQVCKKLDYDQINVHMSVHAPEDLVGLPFPDRSSEAISASFLPIGPFRKILSATRETVVNLDDFGQATPATQCAGMQWLGVGGRELSGHVIPDCVTFVLASNSTSDGANVMGFPQPVKNRMGAILKIEAHLPTWLAWARKAEIHPYVLMFLQQQPHLLMHFDPRNMAPEESYPSPRSWERAATMLTALEADWPDANTSILTEILTGIVGPTAASAYVAQRNMLRELPTYQELLQTPKTATLPKKSTAQAAVAANLEHLLMGLEATEHFVALLTYMERMSTDVQVRILSTVKNSLDSNDLSEISPELEARYNVLTRPAPSTSVAASA